MANAAPVDGSDDSLGSIIATIIRNYQIANPAAPPHTKIQINFPNNTNVSLDPNVLPNVTVTDAAQNPLSVKDAAPYIESAYALLQHAHVVWHSNAGVLSASSVLFEEDEGINDIKKTVDALLFTYQHYNPNRVFVYFPNLHKSVILIPPYVVYDHQTDLQTPLILGSWIEIAAYDAVRNPQFQWQLQQNTQDIYTTVTAVPPPPPPVDQQGAD